MPRDRSAEHDGDGIASEFQNERLWLLLPTRPVTWRHRYCLPLRGANQTVVVRALGVCRGEVKGQSEGKKRQPHQGINRHTIPRKHWRLLHQFACNSKKSGFWGWVTLTLKC